MRNNHFIPLLLSATLAMTLQAMDLPTQARGWMKMDVSGTLTALDPAVLSLTSWGKELGASPELKLQGMSQVPDFWIPANGGGAWVIAGSQLISFSRTGLKLESTKLPAPVGDVSWDGRSLLLSYRSQDPYLEKRSMKDGKLLWSVGVPPRPGSATARARHFVTLDSQERVLVVTEGSPSCLILDGDKGQVLNQALFTIDGKEGPSLPVQADLPATLHWVPGQNAYLRAADGTALGTRPGVTLVRYDIARNQMTLHPTGLAAGHILLGVYDDEAFFAKPEGGITTLPFKTPAP